LLKSLKNSSRIIYLDGIRGWASLIVLFHHLLPCFLAKSTIQYRTPHLNFITNGHFAVIVFFVLSGVALTRSFKKENKLSYSFIARYFRLVMPIFSTALIGYILIKFGFMYNLSLADTHEIQKDWLGKWFNFEPSLVGVISFSFFDVFFNYRSEVSYNSSLWTMPIEIFGSYLIFTYLFLFKFHEKKNLIAIFIAVSLYFINTFLSCFMFGYLINSLVEKCPPKNTIRWITRISLMIFFFATLYYLNYFSLKHRIEFFLSFFLILSISYSDILQKFFSNRISIFLGKISFTLYLIQIYIICSWSAFLYGVMEEKSFSQFQIANTVLLSTVFLCIIISYLLVCLDLKSIKYAKFISGKITDKLI